MSEFPKYIIMPDKVYLLSVAPTTEGRAYERVLKDYVFRLENPIVSEDVQQGRLGASRQLSDDYQGYNVVVPLEWLLVRFLNHYIRTNSIHILSSPGGEVLKSSSYKEYLGKDTDDDDVEKTLRIILGSWVRVLPKQEITLGDIYGSTDVPIDPLKRGLNFLKHLGHIEETKPDTYKISPSIFDAKFFNRLQVSMDRKSNRYYQEVRIEANEPFCFVIMPFREEEFPQRIYRDVIKPFVEDTFEISCYRVDEDHLPDRIDNKIYSYLLRAAFIIADVTTANPNVFYELGLAHMLEKDCIILTQKSASEIPFDINRIRAEKYDNDDQLLGILRESISALAFKIK